MPDSFSSGQEPQQEPTTTEQQPTVSFKVGEREYDVEAATKKISAADEHIQKLEEENAKLRSNAEATAKLEEALAKLEAMQTQHRDSDDPNKGKDVDVNRVVEEKLAELLKQRDSDAMAARRKQIAEQTFQETVKTLEAKFGDKVDQEVEARLKEVGVSFEKGLKMASDPEEAKILLKLLGTNAPAPSRMPSSSVSTPTPPVNHESREQELVSQLRQANRSRDRTQAFRELAEHYSSPEAMQALRDKWSDLHH